MRDEYPPFRLDNGGPDPASGSVDVAPPDGPGSPPEDQQELPLVAV
jgi:hypothetical protein